MTKSELKDIIKEIINESVSRNIRNIVFDFGGVLIKDNYSMITDLYNKINDDNISEDDIESIIKGFHKYADNNDDKSNNDIIEDYKKHVPSIHLEYYYEIINCATNIGKLCDYTDTLLRSLKDKGYKLYYISNQSRYGWENHVKYEMQPVMKYFEGGIISCYTKFKKPDINIFNLFIDKYSINCEESLFIDDKDKNITAAKSVGMKARVFNKDTLNYLNRIV